MGATLCVWGLLVAEPGLWGIQASVGTAHGLVVVAPGQESTSLIVVARGLGCSAAYFFQ